MAETQFKELETTKILAEGKVASFKLLDHLQQRYGANDFCPADIKLHKNGNVLYATVEQDDGGIVILERWELEQFKDSKVY